MARNIEIKARLAEASGLAEAHRLMAAPGIGESALIAGAYVDLLTASPANA